MHGVPENYMAKSSRVYLPVLPRIHEINRRQQLIQPLDHIAGNVQANGAALMGLQRLHIPDGLRVVERGEAVRRIRDGDVMRVICRDEEEYTRIRPTLVQLARAVQITRPIPHRDRPLAGMTPAAADVL